MRAAGWRGDHDRSTDGSRERTADVGVDVLGKDDGSLGLLVVVPSGSRTDEIGIRVIGGADPSSCRGAWVWDQPASSRAARSTLCPARPRLVVPIVELSASCAGIACALTETCVEGTCRSALIPDPSLCASTDGCGEGVLYPAGGRRRAWRWRYGQRRRGLAVRWMWRCSRAAGGLAVADEIAMPHA